MAAIDKREGRAKPWRARYRDELGKQHAKHFARKVDARRWLDTITADVVTGNYVDPAAGAVTLARFYATWAPRQDWQPGTVKAMDLAMKDCSFAELPMARLRRSHVESWLSTMRGRGLAPGTIRTRLHNVRTVLRGAVIDRHLAADPTVGVTLPRVRRTEASMRLPTAEEVAGILATADSTTRIMVLLAAGAGLRLGELCGLQVGDIDFLRRALHVRRQLQRAPGGDVVESLPKYGSERDVAVPDELLTEISAYIAQHRASGEPSRWLLIGPTGEPLHQNTAGERWRRCCRAAGVAGVRMHDLRHFFASGLIHAGVDVVAVQRALGHQSATVTLNTYSHLWPSAEDRTRAAARDLLAGVAAAAPAVLVDRVRTRQS